MIYKLEKYLNAGYSHLDAQRELSRIYHNATSSPEAEKVVRVTKAGAIQEVHVGKIPRSRYATR